MNEEQLKEVIKRLAEGSIANSIPYTKRKEMLQFPQNMWPQFILQEAVKAALFEVQTGKSSYQTV